MAHHNPQSQNRALMAQKRDIAAQLLKRGLRIGQIATQLRCSPLFVRNVRNSLIQEEGARRVS